MDGDFGAGLEFFIARVSAVVGRKILQISDSIEWLAAKGTLTTSLRRSPLASSALATI